MDKRIDVIATLMKLKGTVHDLRELELAYAPPFSSAKDPVNMVGYTAENILSGQANVLMWHEMADLDLSQIALLDVRTAGENRRGSIPGATLIPVDSLREHIETLDKSKTYAIFCAVGIRGNIACQMMNQHGFKTLNLMGGFGFYDAVMRGYSQ